MPRIVDLSLTLHPGIQGVEYEDQSTFASKGWHTRLLHLHSHAGTHLDAPSHFLENGLTLDKVALEKCIGPAWVIDLSFLGSRDLVTVEHLAPYADRVTHGARLLLRTGWSAHADMPDYRTHFPRVSLSLAQWFAQRGIFLLGVETPAVASMDDREELISVHQVLLRAEIVIVEGLANLDALSTDRVTFIALPLKLKDGDSSPVRAVAIEGIL
ncbi:MAG: cyclase family protein [Anaerolineae bacterium]